MTNHGRRIFGRLLPLGAAAALLLAACGAAATPTPVPATPAPAATPSAAPSETPEASAEPSQSPEASASADEYKVTVATSAKDGTYLAGTDGMALYIFKKDTGSTSACTDSCADNWPPFTVEAGESATAGDGVTGTFATIDRADGTKQVTYNGAPLYYFAADKAAGDTNGQGINDVWFLATPTTTSSGSNPPSGGYDPGGYGSGNYAP